MGQAGLKRIVEKLSPDLDRGIIDDFFCRMDQDYFSLYTPAEISSHIRMAWSLNHEHPVQLEMRPCGRGRFDIIIVAFDYFSELSIICGTLTYFGFDIQAGNIYTLSRKISGHQDNRDIGKTGPTDSPTKIVDIFHLFLRHGETFNISRGGGI